MATFVNIHAAKTHLSKLIERVEAGEEIVIARAGKPVVAMKPYAPETQKPPRQLGGSWEGKVWVSPDFDEPDPEFEDLFYNGEILPPD